MRMTKKVLSVVLAVLMVVSMMSVMAVSASATSADFYVVGTMNSWDISADYKMVLNTNNESEYWIQNVPLHSGDEIKVVSSTDGSTVQYWYPDGFDNNYEIEEDGYYNVYVDPAGHNGWYYNCIYVSYQSDLTYAAQIGNAKYETLAAAIAAAQSGDAIELLSDIDVTERIVINKDITIKGEGHTLKTTAAAADCMFIYGTKDHKLTISNAVLDGNNLSENAIWTQASGGGSTQSAEVTLTDVTVKNFKGYTYVGAVYLFSNAVGNFNNCVFQNNATPSDSDDGLSGKDIWAGAKATVNINNGTIGDVYLHGGSASVTVDGNATVGTVKYGFTNAGEDSTKMKATVVSGTVGEVALGTGIQLAEENFVAASTADLTNAPAGYKWVDSAETGKKTLAPIEYVAQIGSTKYETLEAAFAAAVDGNTITVLADSTGNGIKAPQGKFSTQGLTVDFDGHTYTVNANTVGSAGTETQAFQLLKDNKITFQNGTITSSVAKMLVQNYSNLTLDNMVLDGRNLDGSGRYTLSNNNGNVVINDTTIYAKGGKDSGNYAFDVCRYSSYPSVNVTVKGASVINGDVEISASKGDAKEGFSLTLEGGTMDGNIIVDASAQSLVGEDNKVTKKDTFTQDAPAGYAWVDNGDGTSSLSHVHDWDYENVSWTFTENASHSIYAKYTLTCKTDATHTKEQTGSGTLMSTVAVSGDKFVYSHSAVTIDGNSVAVPNYTRNVADGIINRNELVAASKVAGEYKLANDITGFYDSVKPVDGFVLDGQNHMIKYGTMNANNRVMFVAADQNTKFTLKNITLDGNTRAKWAVCAYTGNSGNNAGNVITLEGVTIQNFKSNDYVGAINAFGSSTWNLKDCTITGNTTVDDSDGLSGSAVWAGSKATINIDGGTYDEVYLHSYSGTGAVLNADGGATINNLVLDLTKTDTLKANIDDATVGAITANDGTIPEEAVVMDPAKATVAAPEGYKWVDSDETGMKTLAQIVYVAQIDSTKYETIGDAIEAAQDGDTIEILDDVNIGANWYRVNKEVTFDLGGNTVTGNDSFIVVGSEGDVTIKNGTVTSDVSGDYVLYADGNLKIAHDAIIKATAAKGNGVIVRNGGVLDVEGTIESGYYSIAGFGTAIVNVYDGASITSTDASALSGNGSSGAEGYTFNVMGGTLTSTNDVAIYHPNQGTLNITGGTITGATAIYIKSGSTDVSSSSTSIEGATIRGTGADTALVHSGNGCNPTGDAIVIENCGYPGGTPDIEISGGTIISQNADAVASYGYQSYEPVKGFVSGGSFSNVVPEEYCAEGYKPVTTADGEGMYTVTTKTLQEEVDANFSVEDIAHVRFVDGAGQNVEIVSKAQILGVQLRKAPEDGGVYTDGASNGIRFITAVDKEFLNAHPEIVNYGYNVTINGNTRFFSVKGTTNNVIETDDNDYNYYTFAITNIPEDNSDEIKVQFVFTTDGSTIAAKAAYKNASGVSHELVTNYADVKNY